MAGTVTIAWVAGAAGASTATLDPAKKGTFVVLAGGNLTATLSSFTGQVLSTIVIPASGKYQAEFTYTIAGNVVCGIDLGTANLEDACGNDATGYGVYALNGNLYKNGVVLGAGSAITNGQKVTIGIDMTALTIQAKVDGVLQYSGAVSISSATYYFAAGFLSTTGQVTVNFTVATMAYPFAGYGQI